jgi:MFS transporter, DHA1 family, inner membrane transport protein
MTVQRSGETGSRLALWMLLTGNFIIGTGVLLPAGLLNELSGDLRVSAATAGYLTLASGLVVGIGAPVLAGMTSAVDRRKLLTFALVLFAAGHVASALAPNFTALFIVRVLMIISAAIFTPQAAATVALLVPPEKRSAAIAFIFVGWSSASVAGVPLGSFIASHFGWRWAYGGMAVACIVLAILVWRVLRPGLFVAPLGFAAWRQALTMPAILAVLLVTLLSMSGQFTVISYFAPVIAKGFRGGASEIQLIFAIFGLTGVAGNWLASRVVNQIGVTQVIAISIMGLVAGLGLLALSFGHLSLALVGVGIWGLGSFGSNSLQQSRLVVIAPHLAAATVALNTSVVYLGQSVGAGVGGWIVDRGMSPAIAWTACAFAIAALIMSLAASRISAGSGAAR